MSVPKLMFADKIGPARKWFAWFPVQTFDGVWVWMKPVARIRHQSKPHLHGPDMQWWVYALPEDINNSQA